MRRKRLLWKLYPSYLLITLLSLLTLAWYASGSLRQFYLEQIAAELEERAYLIERLVEDRFLPDKQAEVDALCKDMGAKTSTRITVTLLSGLVLGDSEEDPHLMENHADRPEIKEALEKGVGSATRYSYTLRRNMMYVAIPAEKDGAVLGTVRTSMAVMTIHEVLRGIYVKIALWGLVVALFAAGVSLVISRWMAGPLAEMRQGAQRFSQGDLGHRLRAPDSEEMGALAETMNSMAAQLDERIRTVTRQRNELEAVLSSMVEAVLVVDPEEQIVQLNQAATRWFEIEPDKAKGRNIREVVRNTDLHQMVINALSSEKPVEGDIVLYNGEERFLYATGTVLRDVQGQRIGAMLVLNDVTRLKKLENIRRDFVANVSHELKTPITSIKGSVETLREGAMQDPEAAERFLDIIARHSDRLNTIVEDLLSLSHLEQVLEKEEIPVEEGWIKPTLENAILICNSEAADKDIEVELTCPDKVRARFNAELLEHAVVNLIDNAIKYSEPGSRVRVIGVQSEGETVIKVQDWGCGIAKEHLPRLFERFYRVDKARSRKLGGTGLGLSIVKHIVNAHGGRVTVESKPSQGSTFSIYLRGR